MRNTLFILCAAAAVASLALAMPYNPGPAGSVDYSKNILRRVAEPHADGLNDGSSPKGTKALGDTVRGIVLLIQFPDMPADTAHPGTRYQQMLFDGPWPYGTMTEYYHEVSYNQFTVIGTVDTVWYTAANPHDYYGYSNGMARAAELVREAVLAADPVVNFSQYDNNGDGQVDGLFVIHAGPGREEGSAGDTNIHSHKWYLSSAGAGSVTTDGVTVDLYSIEPEEHFYSQYSVGYNNIISKGVFCHEFGHVIGLPDLYDTDYTSQGIGDYCLMSGGSWGGNGGTPFCPVHPCAWVKSRRYTMKRSWLTPTIVTTNLYDQKLPPVETSSSAFKFWKNGVYTGSTQYFLVENRRRIGHDQYLPNDGLLIWHIDSSRTNNNNEARKLVDLECATGLWYGGGTKDHLDTTMASFDNGDYWCPSTKTAFDPFSDPSSKDYSNALTMCAAYNIAQANGDTMKLDIFVGGADLTLTGQRLNDAAGDHDSLAEPGESVGLAVTLANAAGWVNATGITATLRTADTSIAITDSTAVFPNINAGASATCSADSFVFYVKPGIFPHKVTFILAKACTQGTYDRSDTFEVPVGTPRVLLVDDDNGAAFEPYYQAALDSNGILYRTWTVASRGSPAPDTLALFPVVVWFTGNDSLTTLTGADTIALKSYLAVGGKLFLSSKQLGQQLGTTGFYQDVLKTQYVANTVSQVGIRGVPGDPIGGGLADTVMLSGAGGAGNYASSDKILPQAGADSCFAFRNGLGIAAIKYAGTYKLVYFGFPFESIAGTPGRHRSKTEIMYRVMNWLGGVMPVAGVGQQFATGSAAGPALLRRNTPNPFGARTTISYQLPAAARIRLTLYNVLGQQVAVLADGPRAAGEHAVSWDGRDRSGRAMPNGLYFFRLEASGQRTAVQKAMLLR